MSGCGDLTLVEVPTRVAVRDTVTRVTVVHSPARVLVRDRAADVTVVQVPSRVVVRGVGVQGPPGPAGSAQAERIQFDVQAGFDIPAYHLVVPRVVEATVRLADNSVMAHMDRPIWMALTGALTGETFTVLALGLVQNPSWSWAQGPVYLGEDGTLTQTPPAAPDASFSAQVGYSVGPTGLFYERTPPLLLT